MPDLTNENDRKSWQIEDYKTFNIPYLFFVKGRQFSIFYKFDEFEIDFWASFKWLSSLLVVFLCSTIMTNFDKHNNFNNKFRMRINKIQWIKL